MHKQSVAGLPFHAEEASPVHAYICAFLLQTPDQDLEVRRVEQRVDPLSNEVFVRSVFCPKDKKVERDEDNDEEEEEEELGEAGEGSDTQGKDLFDEDLVRYSVPYSGNF